MWYFRFSRRQVFWDIVPCRLVVVDRRFRGAYCIYHQGDEYNYSYPRRISYSHPVTSPLSTYPHGLSWSSFLLPCFLWISYIFLHQNLSATCVSPDTTTAIKSRRMRWAGCLKRTERMTNAYRILVKILKRNKRAGKHRIKWE
jgi:hypothetical protein